MNLHKYLSVAPEIAEAIAQGKPVVALESTILSHGIDLNLLCLLYKFGNHHRMIFGNFSRQFKKIYQLFLIRYHVHSSTGEDVRRTYQNRKTNLIHKLVDISDTRQFTPPRLVYTQFITHRRELLPIFRPVDRLRGSPQDRHLLSV